VFHGSEDKWGAKMRTPVVSIHGEGECWLQMGLRELIGELESQAS